MSGVTFRFWRDGELLGGLYGVALGRAFFGESMFPLCPEASRAALTGLVAFLRERDFLLLDCQQATPHMLAMGAREIPRKGNTGKTIFLNYVSWPLYAAGALKRLPGGYDAVFCFNTSPVLMCWPAIRYAKKHHIPFTNYVLDLWPENLYSVLPVKNRFMRWVAQSVSDSLYRRCDRLIAMSGPLQERLCARTGKSTADVAVIPQYCEDFYAVPQHAAALEAQFAGLVFIVFTGTFTPAQSLDMVIRAVLDARAAGAVLLHLRLVGVGMSSEALQ